MLVEKHFIRNTDDPHRLYPILRAVRRSRFSKTNWHKLLCNTHIIRSINRWVCSSYTSPAPPCCGLIHCIRCVAVSSGYCQLERIGLPISHIVQRYTHRHIHTRTYSVIQLATIQLHNICSLLISGHRFSSWFSWALSICKLKMIVYLVQNSLVHIRILIIISLMYLDVYARLLFTVNIYSNWINRIQTILIFGWISKHWFV